MATVASRSAIATRCPTCSAAARKVAPLTVRSLIKSEFAARVGEKLYGFCPSPACEVVYFAVEEPEQRFHRADIRVRVGQKATESPIPVCYCFDWTTEDIEQEILRTGTTTIPGRIKQKIQQGLCRCETMNPQGTCCLGNVNQAVKEIRAKLAATSATGGTPHDQGHAGSAAPSPSVVVRAKGSGGRGARLAGLGALVTAIMASACCWLPLVLIALGFSAAGVGSLLDRYQPLLLTVTFALLGLAWLLSYRAPLGRLRARLTGKSVSSPAADACCASDTTASPLCQSLFSKEQSTMTSVNHSCCATDPAPNSTECGIPQIDGQLAELVEFGESLIEPSAGQPPRRRFTWGSFTRVMLGVATGMIVLFASFPYWSGLLSGGDSCCAPPNGGAPSGKQAVISAGSCCAPPNGGAASTKQAATGANSCCLPPGGAPPSVATPKQDGQQPIVLELKGLTCEDCAATVRQALSRVPDVAQVQVSFRESRARVDPKPGARLSAGALVKAVEDVGYHAQAVQQSSGPPTNAAKPAPGRANRPANGSPETQARQADPGVEQPKGK